MAKCVGCGVTLQSDDENALGFVPLEYLNEDGVYCKRCYGIKHYGLSYKPTISNQNYFERIDVIKDEKAIVILMIDVMDLTGGFIPNLYKHIGDNKVIILVNKIDLLPRDIKLNKIEETVKKLALENNLNVSSVILISSKKKKNIERLVKKIDDLMEDYDYKTHNFRHNPKLGLSKVYVLGCASVGKSTFLNIFKADMLNEKNLITTSSLMQTTLDFIKITIDKNHTLIDTPGYLNKASYQAYLSDNDNRLLNPTNYLKPRTFQLNTDQTIFMGGLVELNLESEKKIFVSFYVANSLYLHRTKRINKDNVFNNNILKLLKPPSDKKIFDRINNFKSVDFYINEGSYDLIISGVGFVHIVGNNIKVNIKLFEKIDVRLLESFI